jgi:CheY-like chemotaxis protein
VGRLAGGIAHDFNNLITIISNCAELLAAHDCDKGRADVSEIRNAATRAADLTRQLLAFSRRQLLERRSINLSRELTGLKRTLNRLIGEDIQLKMDFAPGLGAILADAGQLEQIILNLAINARDAMPEGGVITATAANRTITAEQKQKLFVVAPGDYVEVRFSDTGSGIAAEEQALIFDPFYTTKAPGLGTGLGLATVYGIVKQHEGHIWVESAPGEGATFVLLFPRVVHAPAAEAPIEESAPIRDHSGARILLVEDEQGIRRVARRVLEKNGYHVVAAAHGQEALDLVEHGAEFDLLLTDIVMPHLSGLELCQKLRARQPGLRVVFMTGYMDDRIADQGFDPAQEILLRKPFAIAELLAAVDRGMRG